MFKNRSVFVPIILCACSFTSASEVYRCVGPDGNVMFTNIQCETDTNKTTVDVPDSESPDPYARTPSIEEQLNYFRASKATNRPSPTHTASHRTSQAKGGMSRQDRKRLEKLGKEADSIRFQMQSYYGKKHRKELQAKLDAVVREMAMIRGDSLPARTSSTGSTVTTTAPSAPTQLIDPFTGKVMPRTGDGYTDPATGTFYHDVGGGVVNTRTGEFIPTN